MKRVLDDLVAKKVIVTVSEASEWAAPLVVIQNAKTGKIRICVDHTRLNKFVLRPRMSDDSAKTISANCRKPFRQSCRIVTYDITDSAKVDSATVQM